MRKSQLRPPLCAALLLAVAAGASAAGAAANQAAPAPNVTIPFAAHDGIEDWQADGSRGLWIQAGELDCCSEVYARDSGHCAFTSLVASDGQPRKVPLPKVKCAKPAPATP